VGTMVETEIHSDPREVLPRSFNVPSRHRKWLW